MSKPYWNPYRDALYAEEPDAETPIMRRIIGYVGAIAVSIAIWYAVIHYGRVWIMAVFN